MSTAPPTANVGSPLATSSPINSSQPTVTAENSKLSFKSWFSSNLSSSQSASVSASGGSGNVSGINTSGDGPQLMGNFSAMSSPSVASTSTGQQPTPTQIGGGGDSGDGTMSVAGASPGQSITMFDSNCPNDNENYETALRNVINSQQQKSKQKTSTSTTSSTSRRTHSLLNLFNLSNINSNNTLQGMIFC